MRSEHLLHHDDITLYVKDYMLLNIYYIDMHTTTDVVSSNLDQGEVYNIM